MKTYLELIRWKNLLMLACTLLLMQYVVVNPTLAIYGWQPMLSTWQVILMITAGVMIAAGGYAVNDYFDVKIDAINRPLTRIVGRLMDRHQAILVHQVLTGVGMLCGLSLAVWLRSFTLGVLYVFVPGLLWFYSASYKRQFVIGNIIVAFNAALSILMVGMANAIPLKAMYGELLQQTPVLRQLYAWILGYAVFAFLCTLLREIIKDIEDETGDREMECHTLPIKLGVNKTKYILYALIVLIIALLCIVNFMCLPFPIKGSLSTRYLIFGLILPLLVLGYLLLVAKRKNDYKAASTMSKFIMLLGLLYSLIYYFLLAKQYGIAIFGLFVIQA